ncbi:MAG: Cache 3/Cache 2 fusion domain-containing protein, partial [Planctomycetes bacterium]|nr:Cache 3/Cache 2 fusion domain-containing protein [Planctomycetota bacterium]
MKLSTRLALSTVIMVTAAVLVVGAGAGLVMASLCTRLTGLAGETMREQGMAGLTTGCAADRAVLDAALRGAQADVVRVASSGNLLAFHRMRLGRNQLMNEMVATEASRVMEGLERLCSLHQRSLEKTLAHHLAVAERCLAQAGGVTVSGRRASWQAVDQSTRAARAIELPVMTVGGSRELVPVASGPDGMPVVDEVVQLVGGACTIFQRMGPAGDMLRVATTVRGADGRRAIGTFIPASRADGSADPVVAAVLAGRTFTGRARVVGTWYITAYQPIRDADGAVQGMLFVGVKEQEERLLVDQLVATPVGRCGLASVVDDAGLVLAHARADQVGRPSPFQAVLAERRARGGVQVGTVAEDGRTRLVTSVTFPPWGWTLAAGAWVDEMNAAAPEAARTQVAADLVQLAALARAGAGAVPLYAGLSVYDAAGHELARVQDGKEAEPAPGTESA